MGRGLDWFLIEGRPTARGLAQESNASCRLAPYRVDSAAKGAPFGLVMIGALASGTPVIASTWGSAPELIEDGRTGFICPDDDAAVAACDRLGELSRADCRTAAEQRFSAARMVGDYEELFRSPVGQAGAARMTG